MSTEHALEPISKDESRDFIRLESVIKRGLDTFIEVGHALAEIRDRRLYRIEHGTFDDYLAQKWNMSRSKASRLIGAAEMARLLPSGNTPKTEAVIRPLAKLPPTERAGAWQEAVAASPTGKPTAKEVQAVVVKVSKPAAGRAGEAPGVSTAPLDGMTWLQTATFAYRQLSADERRLFDNFRAGFDTR